MSFFRNLFKKKEPKWKSRIIPEKEIEPTEEIINPKVNSNDSIEEEEVLMQEGIKEMIEQTNTFKAVKWKSKMENITDEDLIKQSMDKIFPRLKRGSIEHSKGAKMIMPTPEGEKEVNIPAELMMAGYDSGPDFFTGFAIDNDQLFTMIYNKHITFSGMTKQELLHHACQNFQNRIGSKATVTKTIFPNVYQLQTDGNSEASMFLFPTIWSDLKKQIGLSRINLVMPAQNTVLFWDSISDETLAELIEKVTSEVVNYPKGSIVSNYHYQLQDNVFVSLNKLFNIEI